MPETKKAMSPRPLSEEYLARVQRDAEDNGFVLCTHVRQLLAEIERLRRIVDDPNPASRPNVSKARVA